MGTLFVVATPIGNLEDLTARARRILGEVGLVVSEDTRHTGILLKRLGLDKSQLSLHAFNEASRIDRVLEALDSGDVALVTDAGTPGISDPGAMLIQAAAQAGHAVSPVPGPSALTAAMSVSGFSDADALFIGFLPRKSGERSTRLAAAMRLGTAVFFFEAPGRVAKTLAEIAGIEAERQVVVFRELTKLHEEIVRGRAAEITADFASRDRVRGEFVIGIGPPSGPSADQSDDLQSLIDRELQTGDRASEIARRISTITGRPRSEIYDMIRDRKDAAR